MMIVGRRHVLLQKPLVIGRHIERHLKANAHELGCRGNDTFLGHQRADGVDRLKGRRELTDLVEALLGALDTWIRVVGLGLGGWAGIVELP